MSTKKRFLEKGVAIGIDIVSKVKDNAFIIAETNRVVGRCNV